MIVKIYVAVLTVFICTCSVAQRLVLTPGTAFTYTFSFHYTKEKEALPPHSDTYRFAVLRRDDSGFYHVRCTLANFSRDLPGQKAGGVVLPDDPYSNTEDLIGAALLHHPFELVVDTNGYLIRSTGIKEIVSEKANEWELKGPFKQLLLRTAGHNLPWQTREIFPVLPLTPEGWLQDWKSAVSNRAYAVTATNGSTATISYTETIDDGNSLYKSVTELNGELQYDRAARKLLSCIQESTHSGERRGEAPNTIIPYKVEQELLVTLVPDTFRPAPEQDALATVMIKMSNRSMALRNGPGYDATKVYAFFAANDAAWNGRKEYVQQKLNILQSVSASTNYNTYRAALGRTPNALLEGQYPHLYNKLEELVQVNADSAYAVAGYLRKSPLYREWVQQRLAPLFNGPGERVATARELLKKLSSDGDTIIRNAAYPLWLWAEIKYHPADTVLRRDNISLLEDLSPSKARQGNAQRYALLLYQQLYTEGRKEVAARLLIHIIARLEAEANDSSNNNRHAARYLLAYAWQLKYQEAKAENSKIALDYLAKASALSANNSSLLPKASLSDMQFLGSKESYKADFADAALAARDKKQAFTLLAEQVKTDPALVDELKQAYERRYPGKDFGRFLNELSRDN